MTTVDHEIVALWLAFDGIVDSCIKQLIVASRAQRFAQIRCVLLPQAHKQVYRCR